MARTTCSWSKRLEAGGRRSESAVIAEWLEAGPATTSPTVPTAAILGVSTGVAALVVLDPHDLLLHDLRLFGRLGWCGFRCSRFGLGLRIWNRGDSERRRGLLRRLEVGDRRSQLRQFRRRRGARRDRGLASQFVCLAPYDAVCKNEKRTPSRRHCCPSATDVDAK